MTPLSKLSKWTWTEAITGSVECGQSLAPLVAYGIGGPAEVLVHPENESDMELCFKACEQNNIPLTIIGSGTNLLVPDQGIKGVVLNMGVDPKAQPTIIKQDAKQLLITVPAQMSKALLLDWSVKHQVEGLPFSAGIPGTMGGAVYMNAGTKWGSYGDVIQTIRLFHPKKGFFEKNRQELNFQYRGHGHGLLDGKTLVVSVTLLLKKTHDPQKLISDIDEILIYRGQRQPLEYPNCGSVFKNPPTGKGAGRLIEAAELKGLQVGQAMVSKQHANFISNLGGATAADIKTLISTIQKRVWSQFKIKLERELIYL